MVNHRITSIIVFSMFFIGCETRKIQNSIDFQYSSNVLIVRAELNNSIEGLFQLDSGANNSFIRKKYADKLDIQPTGLLKGTGPGENQMELLTAKEITISICGHSQKLTSCAIVDMSNQNVPDEFIGLIGSDYLKEFVLTIDFNENTLIFENEDGLQDRLTRGIQVPIKFYTKSPNIPFVSVILNDSISSDYIFDTGIPVTSLAYVDFIQLNLYNDQRLLKTAKNILNNSIETYSSSISSFGLDTSMEIQNLEIETYKDCIGFIGNNYSSNFIVTLDYQDSLMVLNNY